MNKRRLINKTSRVSVNRNISMFNLKGLKTYILSGVCGLLLLTSIFMTIETSTNGSELAKLQNSEAELLARQQELQQTLVETLSVNTLQEKSLELGFTKIGDLVYVANTLDVKETETVAKLP